MINIKYCIFLVFPSLMLNGFSQEIIKPLDFVGDDSISFNTNIKIKEAVAFEKVKIVLEDVISDTRCPKNLRCDNIGEAIVLLKIYLDGKFLKDIKVSIDGEGYIFESRNMIYRIKDYKIYMSKLYPLPKANKKINKQLYNADFFVRKVYDFDED